MNAVDTNILIYVNDPRAPVKQGVAISLVSALTEGVLLWQVACEYLAASRKLESLGYDRVQAYQHIRDLQQVWYTALPTWSVIDRAENLMGRFSLSTLGFNDYCCLFRSKRSNAVYRGSWILKY